MILSILVLSFSTLSVAAGPVRKLNFAYGTINEEQPVNNLRDSTWYGKVKLLANFKYTVDGCQDFASVILNDVYEHIIEIERSTDKVAEAHDRLFGTSGNAMFALFTHPGSIYGWVGSLPKGSGQSTSKSLIPNKAPLLFAAAGGREQLLDMQLHAEERAYLTFEPDNKSQVLGKAPSTYPPEAVIGSVRAIKNQVERQRRQWQERIKQGKHTGERFLIGQKVPACIADSPDNLFMNKQKNGPACTVIGDRLHVTMKDGDQATQDAGPPTPGQPGSSKANPTNCRRGQALKIKGRVAACLLPSKAYTKPSSTSMQPLPAKPSKTSMNKGPNQSSLATPKREAVQSLQASFARSPATKSAKTVASTTKHKVHTAPAATVMATATKRVPKVGMKTA